jgi:hypothetical protein
MKTLTRTIAVFATVAYAASMTSCSLDDGAGPHGGGEGNDEKAYLAVNVTTRVDATEVRAEGDEITGTVDENKTYSIRVVLYDENNEVKYGWNTPDGITYGPSGQPQHTDIIDEAGSTATLFSMKAREVTRQGYKLLVLINPTAEAIAATAEGATVAGLMTKTADGVATVAKLAGAGGFFMSNAEGLVAVSTSDLFNDAETAEREENRVAVRVDRAVAKVGVKGPASFDTPDSGAELLAWNLDVTNKSMYWVRKQTDGVMPGGTVTPEITSPGNFIARIYRYAEDPNFTGYSYDAWVAAGSPAPPRTDADYPYHFFDYLQNPTANVTKPIPTTLDRVDDADDYLYCLENTMAAAEQWQDVTTSAIIKAKWWPKSSSLAGGATFVEDDPYFVYAAGGRSFIFAADELDDILLGAAGGGIDLDLLEFPALAGMKEELEGILSGSGPLAGTDFATVATGLAATSARDGNLTYNGDNINYYRVPIRHFGNAIQPNSMAYGRFGVVRNNIYELTVNSISGPGKITINTNPADPEDPDDPDEPDEKIIAYIDVTINILPWVLREQNVDL